MDIISCFGDIAEENGWKITKHDDCLYTVTSTFERTCIDPFGFDVYDNGYPVTLGAFVDIVRGEYEDFDISKLTYSLLNSDGYYKDNCSYGLGTVYEDVRRAHSKLNDLCYALSDKYEQIKKNIEFYNEPHTAEELCSRSLEDVLDDESFSDGEIVDMMYSLVRDVVKYAVSHNSSKTNHIARELFGGTFSEEVLKCFDELPNGRDDENEQIRAADDGSNQLIKTVIELCPHCESEIEMLWSVSDRGYKAFCPVCGQRLMLCDECMHSGPDGEFADRCDFCSETDTCKHNQSKNKCEKKKEEE